LYDPNNNIDEFNKLPSLSNYNGYLLSLQTLNYFAIAYTPKSNNSNSDNNESLVYNINPLAWPYHASIDDVIGLPPHVIIVNELDPLCDEGVAYYHKLLKAKVSASCRMLYGTIHAMETSICRLFMPEIHLSILSDIKTFAYKA
jgi:acetyl esterase/lipase